MDLLHYAVVRTHIKATDHNMAMTFPTLITKVDELYGIILDFHEYSTHEHFTLITTGCFG